MADPPHTSPVVALLLEMRSHGFLAARISVDGDAVQLDGIVDLRVEAKRRLIGGPAPEAPRGVAGLYADFGGPAMETIRELAEEATAPRTPRSAAGPLSLVEDDE